MVAEPLNLEYILVNMLSGSMEIFFFLMMIVLAYMAARMRMPNIITIMMAALFIIMMAGLGFQLLYLVTILLVGLIFFFVISKLIKA